MIDDKYERFNIGKNDGLDGSVYGTVVWTWSHG